MKTLKLLLLVPVFAFIILLVNSSSAHAVSGGDWVAGDIIDDSIFTNKDSMSIAQIQAFLNNKVPSCDTNGTQPASEYGRPDLTHAQYAASQGWASPPYVCLKDYYEVPKTSPSTTQPANNFSGSIPSGAKSAAELIWNAAQTYNISPQVLLVKLQTESSGPLTTDTWPLYSQYKYAMGAHCPDSGPGGSANCDPNYSGFSIQISEAAALMRYYLDNMSQPWWTYKKPFQTNSILWNVSQTGCGASDVYIQDYATAALYTYTPYQPNQAALNNLYGMGDGCSAYGNRNFWRVFNDLFGTTRVGKQSSPLYKASDSDTIYIIADGTKYPVASFDIINALGLNSYSVAIVSSSLLSQYPTGATISTTLGKKANDSSGTIYLFDAGKRYPVDIGSCKNNLDGTPNNSTTWGLDCFNSSVVNSLPNSLVDNYTVQDIKLPNVILSGDSAWKLENGKKRRITDPVFVDILGGWANVRWMAPINASQPEGQLLIPANSTVKFTGNDTIYFKTETGLLPVNSMDDYKNWGLDKVPSYSINGAFNQIDPLPVGASLTSLIKNSSGSYYLLTTDKKIVSIGSSPSWPVTNATTGVDSYLNTFQLIFDSGLYRSSSTGNIFIVENGKERVFATIDDLKGVGYNTSQINNLPGSLESTLQYDGLKLKQSRMFKVSGSDAIYYTTGTNSSVQVQSTNYPGLPYSGLITVDSTTGAKYPSSGYYKP